MLITVLVCKKIISSEAICWSPCLDVKLTSAERQHGLTVKLEWLVVNPFCCLSVTAAHPICTGATPKDSGISCSLTVTKVLTGIKSMSALCRIHVTVSAVYQTMLNLGVCFDLGLNELGTTCRLRRSTSLLVSHGKINRFLVMACARNSLG
jgi:hypothetical protein